MSTTREQELVDICFQLVLAATDKRNAEFFAERDNDGKAAWVAEKLEACGFPTRQSSACWGVLIPAEISP